MLSLASHIRIFKNYSETTGKFNSPLESDWTPVNERTYNLDAENPDQGITKIVNNEPIEGTEEYVSLLEAGHTVQIDLYFVNNIEIESSFKNLTKTAKITLPRKLTFNGINLVTGQFPLFNRGDLILIELGYEYVDNNNNLKTTRKEVFRGYVTKIGQTVPITIECEDQMFMLKQALVQYPDNNTYPKESNTPISFSSLIQRLLSKQNTLLLPQQQIFNFNPTQLNSATHKDPNGLIPVYISLNTNNLTYSTQGKKTLAEVFKELKQKYGIVCYFDDFSNLHFEMPYINTKELAILSGSAKTLHYESQIIDDKNMKYQRAEDTYVRLVYSSQCTDKKYPTLYASNPNTTDKFYGDALGDTITYNTPAYNPAYSAQTQSELNHLAELKYYSEKYTGYAKGSTFETFGEPTIYVGQSVKLTSSKYPERDGIFQVSGVKRKFGMSGYRQIIEVAIDISKNKFPTQ